MFSGMVAHLTHTSQGSFAWLRKLQPQLEGEAA